jgi:hypothetical protein
VVVNPPRQDETTFPSWPILTNSNLDYWLLEIRVSSRSARIRPNNCGRIPTRQNISCCLQAGAPPQERLPRSENLPASAPDKKLNACREAARTGESGRAFCDPDRSVGVEGEGRGPLPTADQCHLETTSMPRSSHVPCRRLTPWPIVSDLQHFGERWRLEILIEHANGRAAVSALGIVLTIIRFSSIGTDPCPSSGPTQARRRARWRSC